jgi:aspartate ammonia-lyase
MIMRKERDFLGELEIPDEALYGIQTQRAVSNFPVSGIMERKELINAYVLVKTAAALVNMKLGVLNKKKGDAIVAAADEVLSGKHYDHFVVDVFQAGAGTSFNMNVNEVLANRALEILGKKRGEYEYLSPNDHVNRAQSTNDTFPSASHIAVVMVSGDLVNAIEELVVAFEKKGKEFSRIPKSGRTHLMDATPLTLGHEFKAYAASLKRAEKRIKQRRDDLLEIPLGSTAVGTGVNAHPDYRKEVIKELSELTSFAFKPAKDSFEGLQSRAQLAAFSGSLRELALELIRIANDLRLLGSGPTTGLSEISLPAVQPGSSIMPGKVNPVMAECLNMVAFQVIGNDTAVGLATQAGQMDLNVFTPVMIHNILESMAILTNYLPEFRSRCVEGITANEEVNRNYLEKNPSLATLLSPKIGHLAAAEIAKEALERGISVKEMALEKGVITEEEAKIIFDQVKLTKSKYE